MNTDDFWKRLALGALAGLAGTMAIQAVRSANKKWMPESQAPINEEPGKFMVHQAEKILPDRAKECVSEKTEKAAAKLLSPGYGITFGMLYAMARPKTKRAIREGALLGVATWAVGYLGWLPVARLMPPVWKQKPKQVALPVAEHAVFGVATVAGYRWLKQRAHV
jgi:hypothetical protein